MAILVAASCVSCSAPLDAAKRSFHFLVLRVTASSFSAVSVVREVHVPGEEQGVERLVELLRA
jgi:hypothetical protein